MKQIIQNEVKCLKCGDIIFSRTRHDFVTCSCGNVSVDGGMSYLRRSWKTEEFEERSMSMEKDHLEAIIKKLDVAKEIEKENQKDYIIAAIIIDLMVYRYLNDNYKPNQETNEDFKKIIEDSISLDRNSLGILLAIIRYLRDNDYLNMEALK